MNINKYDSDDECDDFIDVTSESEKTKRLLSEIKNTYKCVYFCIVLRVPPLVRSMHTRIRV